MEETKQLKSQVTLQQKQGTFDYKIIIPADVERKIRFACQQSWDTEWSGTLFFNYKGTFEDNNLTIICKDIFIMDVGNATYTEFDMNPDVINYMTNNMELLDCQMGLIHSHNNMSTFFSGTDQSTLKEEGTDRNNFVSLIVNNAGTYTAAITRKVKSTKTIRNCYSYDFFGEGNKENCNDYVTESEEIEWYYLKVDKQGEDDFIKDMADRFAHIKAAKASKASKTSYKKEFPVWENTLYSNEVKGTSKKVSEPTLFDNVEDDHFYKYDEIPFGDVKADRSLIKSLLMQLLTCSLIVPNKNTIDLEKWATNIPALYDKRFISKKVFSDWADSYCEFLTWEATDESLEALGFTDIEIQSIIAFDLIEALEELPQNDYIKEYVNQLEKYIC